MKRSQIEEFHKGLIKNRDTLRENTKRPMPEGQRRLFRMLVIYVDRMVKATEDYLDEGRVENKA